MSASDDGSAVQGVYRGSIHVEHSEKAATGVRAVVLLCDDGRRYVLDPSENSRTPARLDGRRVEILGELRHGFGGGPFLFVRSLTVLP
ncbi:MAG: hypothetical protein IT514_14005 [Burkholderiales bacterium]|nr:hypothetical protein [Burkholderiales bacterium]